MNFHKIIIAGFIWWGIVLSFQCYGQAEAGTFNYTASQERYSTLVSAYWPGNNEMENIPLGALPMQYNPSFAGEAGAGRLSSSVSYKSYSSLVHTNEQNYNENTWDVYTAYDQFIPALGTGIGITTGYLGRSDVLYDAKSFYYSVAVAPKFSIKGKYTLSPSLDFSHSAGKLGFSDPPPFLSESFNIFSSKAGLLFNTNKYYVGYSVILFNRQTQSNEKGGFLSFGYPDHFKSFLQFGYSFRRSAKSKFSFTPQFTFGLMEKTPYNDFFTWEGINLNFRYSQYIAGVNNTGYHFGLQKERLRIMLSSRIGLPPSYEPNSGNLSFRYFFKNTENGLNQSRF